MAARTARIVEVIGLTIDDALPADIERNGENYTSQVELERQKSDFYGGQHMLQQPPTFAAVTNRTTSLLLDHYHSTSHAASTTLSLPALRNPFRELATIMRPIDSRAALRRSEYDPKTIARDVLVATGLHPNERSLNDHLKPLKTQYSKVNNSSDLATFRWDIVDPGGPAVRSFNMPPMISEDGGTSTNMIPVRGSFKAARGRFSSRERGGPQRVIPVSRLQSKLKHVTMPRRESNMAVIIGPSSPKQHSGQIRRSASDLKGNKSSVEPASDGIIEAANATLNSRVGVVHGSPNLSLVGDRLPINGHQTVSSSNGIPAKRGQPIKYIEEYSQGSGDQIPPKRGRPFKYSPEAYNVASTSQIRKKRGRSFKCHEAGNATSTDQVPKKRGRPFKSPQPEPKFVPFLCEWNGCLAELQNLETLRAHIFTVHDKKQPNDMIPCLWGSCCRIRPVRGEADAPLSLEAADQKFEFKTKEEWHNHVITAHLVPFAWYMGDGPKGTDLGITQNHEFNVSRSWLMDENGQQVTPSVNGQPIEGGRAKTNNEKRFAKKRDGIYVILEPIKNPEAYLKIKDDNSNEGSRDEVGFH